MYECCNDSSYDNIEDWLNSEIDERKVTNDE